MTTIAWDGKTLATDRRTSFGSRITTVTKAHRVNGHLVAGAGITAQINEMIEWFRNGANPATFPAAQRGEDAVSLLVITPTREVRLYGNTPYPLVLEDKFTAIGSGSDFALAAMHCGKSAVEAVEVAAVFDSATGGGVNILHLDPVQRGSAEWTAPQPKPVDVGIPRSPLLRDNKPEDYVDLKPGSYGGTIDTVAG